MLMPLTIFIVVFMALKIGLIINISPSMPLGLYIKTSARVQRGDIVLFFLNRNQVDIPWPRYKTLLKYVIAFPDDRVEVTDQFIAVNHKRYDVITLDKDHQGNYLSKCPRGVYEHTHGYWLLGLHPNSWDSRYWGPINASQFIAVLKPLLVWTTKKYSIVSEFNLNQNNS